MLAWLYLGTLALCFLHLRMPALDGRRRRTVRNLTIAVSVLIFLTWVQAPSLITDGARGLARLQGWYAERRAYQAEIVGLLVVTGLGITGHQLLRWRQRGACLTHAVIAVTGLFVLLTVRTVSLHHIDKLLALKTFGQPIAFIVEAGLLTIAAAALAASIAKTRKAARRSL